MPELPEVQTIVDDLQAAGVMRRGIMRARVFWPNTIANVTVKQFCRQVAGRKILSLSRRGKYIVFRLSGSLSLVVHLRMTGRFQLMPSDAELCCHVQIMLLLDDKRVLAFHDTRKFGRMYLVSDPLDLLAHLGPEPLDNTFTAGHLARMLTAHRRQIKPLLMDQSFIAGLGNIYVDEALWDARIHPLRRSDMLNDEEVRALYRAIRRVLRSGLKYKGTSLGEGQGNFQSPVLEHGNNAQYLKVYQRTGEPCNRCQARIIKLIVGQRSTHICPSCQVLK